MTLHNLEMEIDRRLLHGGDYRDQALLDLLARFRQGLNDGEFRAVEPVAGQWRVNLWVKRGLLLHRLAGRMQARANGCFDLDTLPHRQLTDADAVRVPSGGSHIHDGVYLGPGAAIMSPSTVHIGARLAAGAMIDGHCLLGACTQVEAGARLGPGTLIGGVIEPLTALPTIIGENVIIAGNSGIHSGVVIGEGAFIAHGVNLNAQTPVVDLVKRELRVATEHQPLTIPPFAVVVPAVRLVNQGIAEGMGLSFPSAVITAYSNDAGFNGDPYQKLQ